MLTARGRWRPCFFFFFISRRNLLRQRNDEQVSLGTVALCRRSGTSGTSGTPPPSNLCWRVMVAGGTRCMHRIRMHPGLMRFSCLQGSEAMYYFKACHESCPSLFPHLADLIRCKIQARQYRSERRHAANRYCVALLIIMKAEMPRAVSNSRTPLPVRDVTSERYICDYLFFFIHLQNATKYEPCRKHKNIPQRE